jgi:hypothetical protein
MGYNGQHNTEAFDVTNFDGEKSFTESLRRRAAWVIRIAEDHKFFTSPDPTLASELYELAVQDPFPSHQARQLLLILAERGLVPFGKNYDQMTGKAWEAEGADLPNLARIALKDVGIRNEFLAGDDSIQLLESNN